MKRSMITDKEIMNTLRYVMRVRDFKDSIDDIDRLMLSRISSLIRQPFIVKDMETVDVTLSQVTDSKKIVTTVSPKRPTTDINPFLREQSMTVNNYNIRLIDPIITKVIKREDIHTNEVTIDGYTANGHIITSMMRVNNDHYVGIMVLGDPREEVIINMFMFDDDEDNEVVNVHEVQDSWIEVRGSEGSYLEGITREELHNPTDVVPSLSVLRALSILGLEL